MNEAGNASDVGYVEAEVLQRFVCTACIAN